VKVVLLLIAFSSGALAQDSVQVFSLEKARNILYGIQKLQADTTRKAAIIALQDSANRVCESKFDKAMRALEKESAVGLEREEKIRLLRQ
jgi:hypothetical protein